MEPRSRHQVMTWIALGLLALLGCSKPTREDLVGTWRGTDGASIALRADGAFEASGLSSSLFMPPTGRSSFEGNGTWQLRWRDPYWELALGFDRIEGRPASVERTLLVSGAGKTASLFVWKGEEGGERYVMQHQK